MAAEKPSFTAYLIPKILPALSANKRYFSLLTQQQVDLSRRFARECARNDFGIALVHYLTGKRVAIWLADHLGIKGLPVHYAARKKYIRQKLDSVISDIEQVVMIGAGFDTLCLEYHRKYPKIKFFELDQYSTQRIKLKTLRKMPAAGDNLRFISCDLSRQSLQQVLIENGADNNAKTFFIVEGVMMYLEKSDVEKLLSDISDSGSGGSYIAFSSMLDLSTEDKRTKISDRALAARKEKYKFAAREEEIENMLASVGFRLLDVTKYHELQQGIVSPARVEALKNERAENLYFGAKA